jgi:hypothetical protein
MEKKVPLVSGSLSPRSHTATLSLDTTSQKSAFISLSLSLSLSLPVILFELIVIYVFFLDQILQLQLLVVL